MESQLETIQGLCDWDGSEFANDPHWRFALSTDDVAEIAQADAMLQAQGTPWREMTRDDFLLDGLAEKLQRVQMELEDGCGIARLSKLPVERFAGRLRHIWYGIGLHLGAPRHTAASGL